MSKKETTNKGKSFLSKTKEYITDESNAIPLKSALFFFDAAVISVFPFVVLQMQLLGMTIKEIALIFLLVPVASLLGPVVCGLIADKLGKFNIVVAVNMIITIFIFDLFLLVPPIEKEVISLICSPEQTPLIDVSNTCYECLFSGQPKNLTLENCQFSSNSSINLNEKSEVLYAALENQTSVIITGAHSFGREDNCTLNLVRIFAGNGTLSNKECDAEMNITCELGGITDCDIPKSSSYITTVASFFSLCFIGHFFAAAALTMLDASLLAASRKHGLEMGKQKIMAMVAFGLTPLLAGILIDYHSQKIGEQSFLPAYIMATVFGCIAMLIMLFNDVLVDKNPGNMLAQVGTLVKRLDVDLFLIFCLILGSNFGFIEGYLFIYLKSLDAPNYLLGLTLTVGFFSSIPILYYADRIEKKIGRLGISLMCFTAYAVRMFGYSFMTNPWVSLPFETLEAVTYQLMWITCLKLCPILAPKGLLATMTGIAGASHYSIGKGIGGFLGGFLIDRFGIKGAFRVYGCIAIAEGILYFIAHQCYFKKIFEIREKELNEREQMERRAKESESIDKFDPPQLSSSDGHEVNINKSLLALASSMTSVIPPANIVRRRECVSVYDNITDDPKTVISKDSDSLLYPFNEMKIISKSDGNLFLPKK